MPGRGKEAGGAMARFMRSSVPWAQQRAKHGETPTLRAVGRVPGERGTKPAPYRTEPKWAAPFIVTQQHLNGLHLRYVIGRDKWPPEVLDQLHGAAAIVMGAVVPIDPPSKDGELTRFWLVKPKAVAQGCVFCAPVGLGDLVFVEVPKGRSFRVPRQRLYQDVVVVYLLGRFQLGPAITPDGVGYLLGLEYREEVLE